MKAIEIFINGLKYSAKQKGFNKLMFLLISLLVQIHASRPFCYSKVLKERIYNFAHILLPKMVKVDGAKFKLFQVEQFMILSPSYEREVMELFKTEIKQESIFIDVGAHIGKYTISLAKLAKKVISIEPDPRNFKYLCENVKINDLNNVIVYNCAASNRRGYRDFYLAAECSSASGFYSYGREIEVETICIDDLIDILEDSEIFLKIDVEGAEFDALLGCERLLRNYNVKLIVEVWHKNEEEVFKFLESLGYKRKWIRGYYDYHTLIYYYFYKNGGDIR